MPTADMPLSITQDQKPSQIWWRFWFALLTRTLQTVPSTVNDAVTAAGTTQGTATQLESEWNVITAGALNTGVVLDGFNIGVSTTVINASGSTKNIYPPSGMQIDALGTNAAYSLTNGKQQTFSQVSDTQFYSGDVGGGGGGGMAIGGAVAGGTPGSVLFVGSGPTLAQDNAKLFWDDTGFSLNLKAGSTLALGGSASGTVTIATQAAAGTWTLKLPTTAGTNLFVLQTDGSGNTSWVAQTGGGGGMAIGGAVSGGTPGSVLFVNGSSNLAQDNANFFWDDANFILKLGHSGATTTALFINTLPAIFEVPNASGNNWFEGNAGNTTLTGFGNFGTGDKALFSITTGSSNVALGGAGNVGTSPCQALTTGNENVAIGAGAHAANTSSSNCLSIGAGALASSGQLGGDDRNIAIGHNALTHLGNSAIPNQQGNTAIGASALAGVSTAFGNVAIGDNSFSTVTDASGNTIIGTSFAGGAGSSLTGSVNFNTFLGGWPGPSANISSVVAFSDGAGNLLQDFNYTGGSRIWSYQLTTHPIGLHVYNTTGGGAPPTNYERAILDWNPTANIFRIASQAGGTGTVRLIAIDGFQKAGAPAAGDLPSGTFALINDTSGGQTWLVYNNAGTVRKVQLV